MACTTGDPALKCQSSPTEADSQPTGRRIYIHQTSLLSLAQQGREQALLVYRMVARTVALKAVHHATDDALLLQQGEAAAASGLKENVDLAWSGNATLSLRRIVYRASDPRSRYLVTRVLTDDEEIEASCYFSNYYTFATCAVTARMMFDDTNDIATLRRLKQNGEAYDDLVMINGHSLSMLDANLESLSPAELQELKAFIHAETRDEVRKLAAASVDNIECGSPAFLSKVLDAIDYSFTKGILKAC